MAQKVQPRFTVTNTAISQTEDILRSDSSLEDKLMKLNGLMHVGDTLIYADKSVVSQELSTFLPRLASATVDKTNAADIMLKNVQWQMLTQIVILNDLLVTSEETFLSFVSTLFQVAFSVDSPWLFREGQVSCLTELETTYPGLLVRALPRMYRCIVFERTPAIQACLVLFSLVLHHCFVLSYDIALDDLKHEISTLNPKSSPQKNKQEGVKISFKYVISYRVFKNKEFAYERSDDFDKFGNAQFVALMKDRIRLCSSVSQFFVGQQLPGIAVGEPTLSNNLLYLFDHCSRQANETSSLASLPNSDFLSFHFKHMILSWYLSFISSQSTTIDESTVINAVARAAFCNSFDVSFKQLVCATLRSNSVNAVSSFSTLPSINSDALLAVLRYLVIAHQCKNDRLVQSMCNVFIVYIFHSRRETSSSINAIVVEALDCFKSAENGTALVDAFSRQLELFCLKNESERYRKVARLIADFLPVFSKLAFLRLDFDKSYLTIFCELMTNVEKKRFSLTMDKASAFLRFLCSFLSMKPDYVVGHKLGEDEKMLNNLRELDCDVAQLAAMLITYCSSNGSIVVPCSKKFLDVAEFRAMDSDEFKWSLSLIPVYEYSSFDITLADGPIDSLADLVKCFNKQNENMPASNNSALDMRFLLAFDDHGIELGSSRLCYALNIELFALSCFMNIDRKMVGSYGLPVLDLATSDRQLHFNAKLEGVSTKQPYHEKLITRVSFSTGCSTIYSAWLKPFAVNLTDILVPLRLVGNSLLNNVSESIFASLSDDVQKMDPDLGWIDSIFRTNVTPQKLAESEFRQFLLLQTDECYLVGGFIPPSSLLLVNFRFRIAASSTPTLPIRSVFNKDDDEDTDRNNIRDFLDKYNNSCFAFIFTNNALLLRHTYLLLENSFK